MSISRAVIVAMAIAATGFAGRAEGQTAAQAPAAAAKPGSLSGRITAADTGKPLRRAQITLMPTSRSSSVPPIAASTNSLGQYEAKNVPAGSYFVSVTRAGYLTVQYGQRRPGEQGVSVQVRNAEATERIDVALPRQAVLAGTVADDLGQPYPGVRVDALALRYQQGKRVPSPVGVATTDDLGQFRIAGLEPGRYYLVASSTETWKTEKGEVFGFASTYYPGGPLDRAEIVTLGTAEVKLDLYIPLLAGRTARVSGRVQRETGEPVGAATVALGYSYPGVMMTGGMRTVRTGSDGSFDIKNVTPGVYNVRGGSASQIVTVAGADIDGIALVTRVGSTVTGVMVTDDGTPPPFAPSGVRVLLDAPTGDVLPTVRVVGVETDWSFKMTNLGGPFLFRVMGIPDDWMLGSVRLEDKDITDVPWDVPTGGKAFSGLQVVVTQKMGRVSGTVLDANGKAASGASIVIFPEDSALWMPASRFIRIARPDADGRFSLSAMPAGGYLAIAQAFIENGQWEDPAFLEAARDTAVRFVLMEGGAETITLKLPAAR